VSIKGKNIQAINFEGSDSENENLRVGLIKCNTRNKQWTQEILIENQLVNFKLDSGSDANTMPWIILKKLDMPYEVHTEKLEPYIGPTFETMGKVKLHVEVPNHSEGSVEFFYCGKCQNTNLGRK
jgi:hypothetical protein